MQNLSAGQMDRRLASLLLIVSKEPLRVALMIGGVSWTSVRTRARVGEGVGGREGFVVGDRMTL
jgi:hypothetical protein